MTLTERSTWLRMQIMDLCQNSGAGHISSSLSCADILVSLYYSGAMAGSRLYCSKGHIGPALYPILSDLGFFPNSYLDGFGKAGGLIGGHIDRSVPGCEISSGSLGQGFGISVGVALAAKLNRQSGKVFVLLGDGECCEGAIWEAAMLAPTLGLDNLVAIVDNNGLCATGKLDDILCLQPIGRKFENCGWSVVDCDGNDADAMASILCSLHDNGAPHMIVAHTVKGKGVSFMEGNVDWHARTPNTEECMSAKKEIMSR